MMASPKKFQDHVKPVSYARGVTIWRALGGDRYRGTGTELVAAGLVIAEHLPGQPGMNKVTVTIRADGTIPKFGGNMQQGDRSIHKVSAEKYEITIYAAPDERKRRLEAFKLALDEFHRREREAEAMKRRSEMHLAWCRPPISFTLHTD